MNTARPETVSGSRLRIGIISYRSNPHCGGQGVYVRNLSHALSDLGHEVEVIAGPPSPMLNHHVKLTMLPTLDLYNPDNLFRTPSLSELKSFPNLIEWLDVSTMGYPEPLTFGMRAKKYLSGQFDRYDIIHDNQSLSYGIAAIARHIPVTATIHHPMTVDRAIAVRTTRSFLKKLKHLRWYSFISMQKKVARRLPQIITVSDSSRKDISRSYGIPDHRFRTIPIGIDTTLFHPLPHIRKVPARLIVTNSADTPLKGLYHLMHAIRNISRKRKITLVVIGAPKKGGGIEKLVRTLDLSSCIRFTGRIDSRQFREEYARASIAVVPSMYEGFGLPVGEAMACRVPVISTTGGALPEVAGDAARLVPPGDARALERAIEELLDDPRLCEELAEKGFQRVLSMFTWEKTAAQTVCAYRELIHDYHQV